MKTWPKQALGSLPLAFALPDKRYTKDPALIAVWPEGPQKNFNKKLIINYVIKYYLNEYGYNAFVRYDAIKINKKYVNIECR